MTAYQDLEKRFKRLSDIRGAEGVLHWDSATMMPPGGAEARGEQLATLSVIAHQAITDPALEALLDEAEGRAGNLDGWQSANLREMRRAWRHANAVGADLVEALTREGTACEMAWRGARADDDFAALVPKLASLLGLVREKAAAKAAVFGCSAYDALLDAYDPETSSADIDTIFDDVRAFLPGLIAEVIERQAQAPPPLPLDGAITERTAWLIGHHVEAAALRDGTLGARARRRLEAHEDYDELTLLCDCDRGGRQQGAQVAAVEDALAAWRVLARPGGRR